MKRKNSLIAWLLFLFTIPIAAQTPAPVEDPISGSWKGEIGPGGGQRFSALFELKLDARGAVTGSVTGPPKPGQITSGTFDVKTGALKFVVEVKGEDAPSLFHFNGAVAAGVASGSVKGDGVEGEFKLTKVTSDSASAAQQAGANETTAALQKGYGELRDWVTKAAEITPADKYSYQPTASVRTFSQVLAHIADSYNFYCAAARGEKIQWSDAVEKGPGDKETLVRKLKQATEACNTVYAKGGRIVPMVDNIGHTGLHYGNLITYMRMMGLKPPSS
jgi:hypothetical protein